MFPYIDLGFFKLPVYGLMLLLGFVAAIALARRRAPRYGLSPTAVLDLATWMILAGLAGGRLLSVILDWRWFAEHPAQILLSRSNFVFFGGLVGGTLAALWFCRRRALDFWTVGDAVAPAAALGHAFGRLGCFAQGCCYGARSDLPWAVCFPAHHEVDLFANPAHADHVQRGWIPFDAPYSLPVHPTQLYESLLNVAICALLLFWSRRQRFRGEILLLYLALYGVARFSVEFFRGDPERGGFWVLSTSQWIALAVVTGAAVCYFRRRGETVLPSPLPEPDLAEP